MRKIIPFTFILLLLTERTEAQQWNLVWSDEFTSLPINTANWVFENGTGSGGWGNNELEYYTNRAVNATISNGNLLIIARKESFSGSNYTSARMKTQGKQSWKYGKIEARMKIPLGKGIWPAFWMLGDNIGTVGWPKCGEIDIMEHINTETKTHGTIHWDNNGYVNYGGNTTVNANQYHVYSIEWDSLSIKWFLDGTQFWVANIANNINSTNEFHLPQYIILNLAVGGNWPGSPDATTPFPDTLFVDYVRVSKKATATSMNELVKKELSARIYPNPAGDNMEVIMENAEKGEYSAEVYDILGNSCQRKSFSITANENYVLPFSLDSFKPGIYFVSLRSGNTSISMKFIRQ